MYPEDKNFLTRGFPSKLALFIATGTALEPPPETLVRERLLTIETPEPNPAGI